MSGLKNQPENRVTLESSQHGNSLGFGKIIQLNNTGLWSLARADNAATLGVGIVSRQGSRFEITTSGQLNWKNHGFAIDEYLYLSNVTAGSLTAVAPSVDFSNPLALVVDANTLHLFPYRASLPSLNPVGIGSLFTNVQSFVPSFVNPPTLGTGSIFTARWYRRYDLLHIDYTIYTGTVGYTGNANVINLNFPTIADLGITSFTLDTAKQGDAMTGFRDDGDSSLWGRDVGLSSRTLHPHAAVGGVFMSAVANSYTNQNFIVYNDLANNHRLSISIKIPITEYNVT